MAQNPPAPNINFTDLDDLPPKKSYLPVIIIFICLISLATAAYFYLQTQSLRTQLNTLPLDKGESEGVVVKPSPAETSQQQILDTATADWQIYTDSTNHYSFKYPPEMTQSTYKEGDQTGIQLIVIGPTQTASGRTQSSLSEGLIIRTLLIPNIDPATLAVESKQKDTTVPEGDTPPKSTPIVEIGLNNITAQQYSVGDSTTAVLATFLPIGSNTLRITALYAGFTPSETESYLSQANLILSTFKTIPETCGTCPELAPPAPDFCSTGTIIPGGTDTCGCQKPPTCQ